MTRGRSATRGWPAAAACNGACLKLTAVVHGQLVAGLAHALAVLGLVLDADAQGGVLQSVEGEGGRDRNEKGYNVRSADQQMTKIQTAC